MPRPSPTLFVDRHTPIAIESRALGTLAYIRASIESSGSLDVPGMAGIVMGVIGVAAAIGASRPRWSHLWLEIWVVAAVGAFLLGGALVARQIARRGQTRYWGPARKFLLCLCPVLMAGAVLTYALWNAGTIAFIPGMWLLLYGCAVLAASTVTTAVIMPLLGAMGLLFVILGCISLAFSAVSHAWMLGLGFGGLHILFGILIGRTSHGR